MCLIGNISVKFLGYKCLDFCNRKWKNNSVMKKDKNTNLKSIRKTINNLNQKQIAADRQIIENNFNASDNALLIFDMFCKTPELDIATITNRLRESHNKISRQAVTKIVNKLSGKKIKAEIDPKTGKKTIKEVDSGIRILSRIDDKGKHGAKYRYNAINGSAADLAINTTQTQNSDGLYLCFNGMEQARLQAETKTTTTFRPYKYHNDKPENAKSKHKLFIADNLEFMKAKMDEFEEKFDMLYFDVPYCMISSRFKLAYNDDFDGTCEYLSFLLPRLKLAKKLLKPDGIIAVSIFENEMHYVKCLMDSVYGREQIVNNVVIKTSIPAGPVSGYTQYRLPSTKSYLLIFAKDKSKVNYLSKIYTPVSTKITAAFNTILEKQAPKKPVYTKTPLIDYLQKMPDVVKLFKKHKLDMKKSNITTLMECDKKFEGIMYNDIAQKLYQRVKPKGNPLTKGRKTHFNAPTGEVFELDGRLLEKTANSTVYEFKCFSNKLVKNDDGSISNGEILSDIWDLTSEKSRIANEGSVPFFSKKPIKLLKMLLMLISGKKCDEFLIGDFFAGSASLFHAALDMRDDIKRTCILCQIDEPVQPGSKEYEAGFRRIPQITIKRMKNAVKKHPGEGFQIFR